MEKEKKGAFNKFLDFVERSGNKLPHPVTLFAIFIAVLAVASAVLAAMGVSVEYTGYNRSTGVIEPMTVSAKSLLNGSGVAYIFKNAVTNFTGFAPLGTVLVAMLGVGVAEGSGLISAALKKLVLITPPFLLTAVLVFAGVMSNIASDAGYVVLVPLGGIIFYSFGRHPLAGMAAAFAGVSGGFSANLMIGTIDPLLGGISTESARILDPTYSVSPLANYYFMFASTFVITALGWYVTDKIVEPRLGKYENKVDGDAGTLGTVGKEEARGLRLAGITFLLFVVAICALTIPAAGPLRNPETGTILDHDSPFMSGVVFIIGLGFFLSGLAYGLGSKTFKSDKDVVKSMSAAMGSMGGYLVLAFICAQFINYFTYTNVGTLIAVGGANFLKSVGFNGLPLILTFILISAFINLFIGSASAKWAILAPVFIPMFMQLGISPEMTQLAYRIGDSTTNIISPLMSYFAFVVAYVQKYEKDAGIGTLISIMVPYSMVFLIGWTCLMVIWYLLGLPIGPGSPLTYGM